MAVNSSESVRHNNVQMQNDVLHSINVVFPENLLFENRYNSQNNLPSAIYCILDQDSQTQQNRSQFEESIVREFNHGVLTLARRDNEILPAISIQGAMARNLADIERNFNTQISLTNESPDWSMQKISPALNAASTFREILIEKGQELSPNLLSEKRCFVDSDMLPELFTTDLGTINMDIDYPGAQNNENNQMRINRDAMIATAVIANTDVDYPNTQNDENQAFENDEMTFGRYMINEPTGIVKMNADYHYTGVNKNNRRKKIFTPENLMNDEHGPNNNSIYVHPTSSAYYDPKENEVFKPATVMNQEYLDTAQTNIRTIMNEMLQAVGNQENRFGLQGILENAHNESYEEDLIQEDGPEFMLAFHNNTETYETADEPQPMEQ